MNIFVIIGFWFVLSILIFAMYFDITKYNDFNKIYVGHVFLAMLCLPLTLIILIIYGLYKLFTIRIK